MITRKIHTEYLESEIAKYRRRIKKIRENPDPSKPTANVLLYEAECDLRIAQLRDWKEGKPFGFTIPENAIGRALGLQTCDLMQTADHTFGERAAQYMDWIKREGYTDNACDRTTILLPMILNGDFPAPDLLMTTNQECMPTFLSFTSIARQSGTQVFCVDRPPRYPPDNLRYVTRQLEEMIEFAEMMIPGAKFDEAKLIELQAYEKEYWDYYRDLYQLRRRRPCPMPGRESFREFRLPSLFPDPKKIVKHQRLYRDDMFERAEKGIGAVREERLRLLWAVSGPYFDDPFAFLERLGVTVPFWACTSLADVAGGRQRYYGDETEYGRKLTPLEEQARMTNWGWGAPGDVWTKSLIDCCRDLELEGIVYFVQWGCTVSNGLGKVVSDLAELELNIPTLLIEGRMLDESVYDRQDFFTKLVDFVNVCLERKGLPALTLNEVAAAWPEG